MPIVTMDSKRTARPAEKKENKSKDTESLFVKKLKKALDTKEVELNDGQVVSNMDAIIDNLIGKAIDGDKESVKLIKELTKE